MSDAAPGEVPLAKSFLRMALVRLAPPPLPLGTGGVGGASGMSIMSSGSIRRSGTGARFESSERGGGGHGTSVPEFVGAAAELFGTLTSEAPPSGPSPGGGTVSARPSARIPRTNPTASASTTRVSMILMLETDRQGSRATAKKCPDEPRKAEENAR